MCGEAFDVRPVAFKLIDPRLNEVVQGIDLGVAAQTDAAAQVVHGQQVLFPPLVEDLQEIRLLICDLHKGWETLLMPTTSSPTHAVKSEEQFSKGLLA